MAEEFRPAPLRGILSGPVDAPRRAAAAPPTVAATAGLAVTDRSSGFSGKVVGWETGAVVLRGPLGTERLFPLLPGAFATPDGQVVTLVRPAPAAAGAAAGSRPPATTASGSVPVAGQRALVARASRILVEGVHDAELVEKVWGDDLRLAGVVVERLDGLDHLPAVMRELQPGPGRHLGVLVDHLVAGSKESRLVAEVDHPHVLVTGTPYVDVWQAVRPRAAGITAWPVIPRGEPWKEGVCRALGATDPAAFWRWLLGRVQGYADLEPSLVGAVEQLIDFVTDAG